MHYDAEKNVNYQRPPMPVHYRKISAYLMREDNPILPSAIIAAMGKNDFEYNEDTNELKFLNNIRIVDGQHRIEGFKCLKNGYVKGSAEKYEKLSHSFDLPMLIMVIDDKDIMIEIDAFINLNSKGKRVKTDLAEALKNQINKVKTSDFDKRDNDEELKKEISFDSVRELSKKDESFWSGLIILPDEIGKRKLQPISILTFAKAIYPLVGKILSKEEKEIDKDRIKIIENNVIDILIEAWDVVIDVWPNCFKGRVFDNSYNICKGIGVISIYNVVKDCIQDDNKLDRKLFESTLNKSGIEESDWLVGGTFTGMASAQGIAKITKVIKSEIKKEELEVV